jgi:hypothetical protein
MAAPPLQPKMKNENLIFNQKTLVENIGQTTSTLLPYHIRRIS